MRPQTRTVTFRFCSVRDAVEFMGELTSDGEWEHCNIFHSLDP